MIIYLVKYISGLFHIISKRIFTNEILPISPMFLMLFRFCLKQGKVKDIPRHHQPQVACDGCRMKTNLNCIIRVKIYPHSRTRSNSTWNTSTFNGSLCYFAAAIYLWLYRKQDVIVSNTVSLSRKHDQGQKYIWI